MRRRPQRYSEPEEIRGDMTPMIDIIFQLLIFFMLAMDIKQLEGKLSNYLPRNKSTEPINTELIIFNELTIHVRGDVDGADILLEERPIGRVSMRMTESGYEEDPNNRVTWARLRADLATWWKRAKDEELITKEPPAVKIDPEAGRQPYQYIVRILDQARLNGIDKVEIVGSPDFSEFEK